MDKPWYIHGKAMVKGYLSRSWAVYKTWESYATTIPKPVKVHSNSILPFQRGNITHPTSQPLIGIYNVDVDSSKAFGPYPFILMNLILSCIAALQATIIMMSQNWQEEKDRMRSENNYLINLKAEIGILSLHQKIDLLLGEQIKTLYEIQAK